MWTKLVAGTLFLTFLVFVNLAAGFASSSNHIETSAIAPIAGIFQFLVDVGAVLVIGFVGIRLFVKLAQQTETHSRQYVRQPQSSAQVSSQSQPFEPVNYQGWNGNTPLPFDNHAPAAFDNQTVLQPPPMNMNEPQQGVLVQNIHRMRQQRSGYRIVR
ncbi:MAG: hypothetical protein ABI690_03465 [Chloroflexota bacterium]